jgi:integrase
MRANGEGTIYQRTNGKWAAQIYHGGKRLTKYFDTQKDAKDWITKERKDIQDNTPRDATITIAELMDRYITTVASYTLRETTLTSTNILIRLHINPEIGNIKLCDLRPVHLSQLYAKKLNSGLSPRTVRYIHATIHVALHQAEKWELVSRNVSELVELPKVHRKEFTTLTEEQISAFINVIKGDRLEALYLIALSCGLRRGELLALHWSDVDFKRNTIRVRYSLEILPEKGMVLTNVKTKNSRRTLPVPKTVMDALFQYKNEQDKHEDDWVDNGLVFTTSRGTPLSPRNVVRNFKALAAKAGIPASFRFHDLRHTTASLLLKANVHPKVVQSILGHSQIGVTMDIYSHLMPGVTEDAVGKIERYLR